MRPRWSLALPALLWLPAAIGAQPARSSPPLRAQRPQIVSEREATRYVSQTFERLWQRSAKEDTYRPEIRPLYPLLNFSFRYQTGYRAELPLFPIAPDGGRLILAVRIRPKAPGTEPFYLWDILDVPKIPQDKRLRAFLGGGCYVGEGQYAADLLVWDGQERTGRGSWKFSLKLGKDERAIPNQLPPNTLRAFSQIDPLPERRLDTRPYRVAIVLHAAPLYPRGVTLRGFDRTLLLGTLTTLLGPTPFNEVSVTAVTLVQQKELLRFTKLDRPNLRSLMRQMDALNFGAIGLGELKRPAGHVDLLATVVNREISGGEPPDAVVFIGPNSEADAKFPAGMLEGIPADQRPLFFYLNLDYYSALFPFADTIERLVKGQGGKVFPIHQPKQLANALRTMEEQLAARAARLRKPEPAE